MPRTILPVFIFSLFFFSAVRSQGLYEVPMTEKISHSPLIFEGQVISASSFWNPDHTMIYTSNLVRITKVFQGTARSTEVEVLTSGGIVDNKVITVSELLTLEPGTMGIFFSYPSVSGLKSPVTGRQLLDIYASAQGVLKYDLASQRASSPFENFDDITGKLYPRLEKLTGRKRINLDPAFRVESMRAGMASKEMAPGITSFSPAMVAAGKFSDPANNNLTITGSGFGTPTGMARIAFDNADNGTGGTPLDIAATSDLIVSWTDVQIVVKVPGKAGTGNFTVYDAANVAAVSPVPLQISYAILNAVIPGYSPSNLMFTPYNQNGSGGYSYYYSTNTANSGVNFATSPQEAAFDRALKTWQQSTGVNFTSGGNSTAQINDPYDGINLIVMDNTAIAPADNLPAGTLAVCVSGGYICNGSLWVVMSGFDIIIRNPGVSAGSTTFNNGPCATVGAPIDMESVMLHELGHAMNLGHINDGFKGSFLPNIDPQKVMNFAIVNGTDRRSPDWSALTGGRYTVNPKGLTYCFAITEMTPLNTVITEARDDCPLVFPGAPTPLNTVVNFDLEHSGSNRFVDPQYTAVLTSGLGTAVTNNAWYVIRTNGAGGALNLTVSNYTTSPVAQSACSGAGVELAFYQVSSCPAGQAFPAPVAYRSFNANGSIAALNGLTPNTSYLMMADGLSNTKANFTLTMVGTALPLQFLDFTAIKKGSSVQLDWLTVAEINNEFFEIETSKDGSSFYKIGMVVSNGDNNNQQSYTFSDPAPTTGQNYYRIRQVDRDGRFTYSKIVSVDWSPASSIMLYPNPATDKIFLLLSKPTGSLIVSVYSVNGILLHRESAASVTRQYSIDLRAYASGVYLIEMKTDTSVERSRFIKR
ncbi:MAG: T9SS type A sorting domain-containing protein [Chitinophagaceae bacterium]